MRSAGHRLREILGSAAAATGGQNCVAAPGAFNGLCGRIVADQGFQCAYISGAAVSASAGVPDIGVLTLDHFARSIREVVQASGLPLICDADTGFGEVEMVSRTVAEYIHAGAAGLHLEDQVFPKRCGHLDGKALISTSEMCEKVQRAKAASVKHSNGEFIICARTDARGVHDFNSAVERAKEYVNSGADMIFPEGLASLEEFRLFSDEMKKLKSPPYLLANMTEFGKTPYISVGEFKTAGYHVVIFPVTTLRCAMKPVEDVLKMIQKDGSAENFVPKMFTRQNLYDALRYTPGKEWTFPSSVKET